MNASRKSVESVTQKHENEILVHRNDFDVYVGKRNRSHLGSTYILCNKHGITEMITI